jgi:hypothetical protein
VSPSIADRKKSAEFADTVDAKPSRLRDIVSASNLGITAVLFDGTDMMLKVASHATPGEFALPVLATLVGLGAVVRDKTKKDKKGKP